MQVRISENIGLNRTDEKFEAGQRDGHDQRQRRTKNTQKTQRYLMVTMKPVKTLSVM